MNVLAIIPARGGSKGIPNKNLVLLDGKPLIQYSIEVAKRSGIFQRIVVTSDHEAILNAARGLNVDAVKRPETLATDAISVIPAISHCLQWAEQYVVPDAIMILQPTAPLREPEHLKKAVQLLAEDKEVQSVIGVCEMNEVHPARMYSSTTRYLTSLWPDWETARRQDIPPVLYRNGAIYLVRRDAFLRHESVMVKPALPLIMDKKYLANIDEPRDLLVAETLIKEWNAGRL